jgi:hypothetical protein
MPGGNITCGGQVCGSATFFEPGLQDTSLDVAMFIGGVASLRRGLIEGGLGLLRGAGEAGAGTAAREAGAAVAEQVVAKGGKAGHSGCARKRSSQRTSKAGSEESFCSGNRVGYVYHSVITATAP